MSRPFPAVVSLLAALAGFVAAVGAQSPAQRAQLAGFRDSIAAIGDRELLRAGEAELIRLARANPRDAMLHLKLGFVSMRMGDLASGAERRRHYDDASGEFEWATQEQPSWPWGWYGLGLAELGVGDAEFVLFRGLQTMLGRDALTRSANAFARSVSVDPSFTEALVELGNTALRQRVNIRIGVAMEALRRAAGTRSAEVPAVLLVRGRVEREAGSLDSSRAALRRLVELEPANAVARFEFAVTRLTMRDGGGEEEWYRALASADPAALALFRSDLAHVMPDSMLAALQLPPQERVEAVRRFWDVRDDRDLHPRGARLEEHYRRLDHARRNFRLVSVNRQYDIVERYRSAQQEFDDRGVIYIRHGEPDERTSAAAPGLHANESWLYRREPRNMVFHFVAREDVQDFRLVAGILDILGFGNALAAGQRGTLAEDMLGFGPGGDHAGLLLRSREMLDPVYLRMQTAGRGAAAQYVVEERQAGERTIAVGTTTDSWPLVYRDTLSARLQLLAAGGESESAALQVVAELPPEARSGAVRVRANVITPAGVRVAAVDSSVGPGGIGESGIVRIPVVVPPGRYLVRAAVENDSAGVMSDSVTIDFPGGSDDGVTISDLVLGDRTRGLPWLAPAAGDTAWLQPSGVIGRNSPMELYLEIHGLEQGREYEFKVSIERPGGRSIFRRIFGGGGGLEVSTEGVSTGMPTRVIQQVDLSRLDPGSYRVRVTIRAGRGTELTRERLIEVAR